MPITSVFQPSLLPLSAVSLGRLIRNTKSPHQDYVDPTLPTLPETDRNPQDNYRELLTSTRTIKLRGRLMQLLGASRGSHKHSELDLNATSAYTYSLHNSTPFFKAACGTQAVRAWLQDTIENGYDAYLVVGYHTVVDAQVGGGQGQVTVDTQGASIGIAEMTGLPEVKGLDVGVTVDCGVARVSTRSFVAPGEQVYAVQYRKVAFKWYSWSKKVESGMLTDEMWRVYAGRGEAEDTAEDDTMEALLVGDEGVEEAGEEADGDEYKDKDKDEDKDEDEDEEEDEEEEEERWVSKGGEEVWVL